ARGAVQVAHLSADLLWIRGPHGVQVFTYPLELPLTCIPARHMAIRIQTYLARLERVRDHGDSKTCERLSHANRAPNRHQHLRLRHIAHRFDVLHVPASSFARWHHLAIERLLLHEQLCNVVNRRHDPTPSRKSAANDEPNIACGE